uniref:Histone-lysine N-methyltransferase ash1 n=1 Tax=Macrostomum lignano TaxID=282301 RepID=A0A1I8JIT1_9PLAT
PAITSRPSAAAAAATKQNAVRVVKRRHRRKISSVSFADSSNATAGTDDKENERVAAAADVKQSPTVVNKSKSAKTLVASSATTVSTAVGSTESQINRAPPNLSLSSIACDSEATAYGNFAMSTMVYQRGRSRDRARPAEKLSLPTSGQTKTNKSHERNSNLLASLSPKQDAEPDARHSRSGQRTKKRLDGKSKATLLLDSIAMQSSGVSECVSMSDDIHQPDDAASCTNIDSTIKADALAQKQPSMASVAGCESAIASLNLSASIDKSLEPRAIIAASGAPSAPAQGGSRSCCQFDRSRERSRKLAAARNSLLKSCLLRNSCRQAHLVELMSPSVLLVPLLSSAMMKSSFNRLRLSYPASRDRVYTKRDLGYAMQSSNRDKIKRAKSSFVTSSGLDDKTLPCMQPEFTIIQQSNTEALHSQTGIDSQNFKADLVAEGKTAVTATQFITDQPAGVKLEDCRTSSPAKINNAAQVRSSQAVNFANVVEAGSSTCSVVHSVSQHSLSPMRCQPAVAVVSTLPVATSCDSATTTGYASASSDPHKVAMVPRSIISSSNPRSVELVEEGIQCDGVSSYKSQSQPDLQSSNLYATECLVTVNDSSIRRQYIDSVHASNMYATVSQATIDNSSIRRELLPSIVRQRQRARATGTSLTVAKSYLTETEFTVDDTAMRCQYLSSWHESNIFHTVAPEETMDQSSVRQLYIRSVAPPSPILDVDEDEHQLDKVVSRRVSVPAPSPLVYDQHEPDEVRTLQEHQVEDVAESRQEIQSVNQATEALSCSDADTQTQSDLSSLNKAAVFDNFEDLESANEFSATSYFYDPHDFLTKEAKVERVSLLPNLLPLDCFNFFTVEQGLTEFDMSTLRQVKLLTSEVDEYRLASASELSNATNATAAVRRSKRIQNNPPVRHVPSDWVRVFGYRKHPIRQQLNLLVYDPQSNATPNNKSKSTAAAADEQAMTIAGTNDNAADSENTADAASNSNSMPGRQRKRRSLFGTAKLSPTSKAAKQQRKSTVTGRHKDGASSRRACLTEIIFEDVQKAKELFGFRQKSTVTAAGATEMATTAAATATVTEPTLQSHPVVTRLMQQQQQMEAEPDDSSNVRSRTTTSRRVFAPIALTEDDFDEQKSAVPTAAAMVTLPRRRSHRHRRASSDLVSDAPLSASSVAIDAAAASDLLLTAGHQLNQSSINHASSLEESSFHSQQQQQQLLSQAPSSVRSLPLQQQQQQQQHSPAHQRRVARFWELKRLLVELTKRKADKCRQLAALEAKEKSLSGEFCPRSDSQHHTDHSGSSSLPRNQPNLHQPPQHHQQPHHQSTVGSASGQLCFPTQYLVAVEEETVHS